MINAYEAVTTFMKKHELPINSPWKKDALMLKRLRLVTEEVSELIQGIDARDVENTADAICDTLYVVLGTGVTYGIELPCEFHGVTRGRAVLPIPDQALQYSLNLTKQVGFLAGVIQMQDWVGIKIHLQNLIHETILLGEVCRMDLSRLFTEVHRSNMTKPKLDKDGKGGKTRGYDPPHLKPLLYIE